MKKVMLSCALLISAVVASAIPWSPDAYRHSSALIRAGKLTEARAYLDTIEGVSGTVAIFRAWADKVDENIDASTVEKLSAIVNTYNTAQGFTGTQLKNANDYTILWIYTHGVNDYEAGLAYYNTLENPSASCVARAVVALQQLGRADEAIALAVAHKNWYAAFNAVNAKKDKVKTFEYGKELLLSSYQKAPVVVRVLNAIGNYDYTDTAITKEIQIDFLKAVDVKYRRFMATDEVTWKPILAGVLYSLKSLGVEVVE